MQAVGFSFKVSSNTFWKFSLCLGHVVHIGGVRIVRNRRWWNRVSAGCCLPWRRARLPELGRRGFASKAARTLLHATASVTCPARWLSRPGFLGTWSKIRDIADHFQVDKVAVRQDEVGWPRSRPYKGVPQLHAAEADRHYGGCAVENVRLNLFAKFFNEHPRDIICRSTAVGCDERNGLRGAGNKTLQVPNLVLVDQVAAAAGVHQP